MECQNLQHYNLEPSYIDNLPEYSYNTTTFSLHSDYLTSPCSSNGDQEVFSDLDIEGILQTEMDLVDFDFVYENQAFQPETLPEAEPVPGREDEDIGALPMSGNFQLKDIQDELMEESSLTDLLLMGAEAIEAGNLELVSVSVFRLNSLLSDQEDIDNPLERLALYFTEGLIYKSLNVPEFFAYPISCKTDSLLAFEMLQELSPYVKFAHFTANQAILEATRGHQEVHIIDFDIMDGVQWPSLMADLAARGDVSLQITAVVVPEEQTSSSNIQQTGKRLMEFADSINLVFMFDLLLMAKEEDLENIKIGHPLIANCMINQVHMPRRSTSSVKTFFNGLTKLNPQTVVLVEEDSSNFANISSMSFVEFFVETLQHYAALSDSLVSGFSGNHKLALRAIEKELLRMRILECFKHFPCDRTERIPWRDLHPGAHGFRTIPFSSCNVTQAKFLVSLFNGGYWVQHEHSKLALFWRSRPMTTASIWVPLSQSSPPVSI